MAGKGDAIGAQDNIPPPAGPSRTPGSADHAPNGSTMSPARPKASPGIRSGSGLGAGPKPSASQGGATVSTRDKGPEQPDPPPLVLEGDLICFAEKQFDESSRDELSQMALSMAAHLVPRQECHILIVNPSSTAYDADLSEMASISKIYPVLQQPDVYPYHWLACCLHRRTRVSLADLPTPKPYMVHPDRSTDHHPLKIWVSVNINRHEKEAGPYIAQSNVQKALNEAGALIVERRATADLLVVDRKSAFFSNTVIKERQKYGRKWQRIVEREWVEDCVMRQRLTWPATEEDDDEVDSMIEEEPPRQGRGPGRPTGKPRQDYTHSDDDFLVRYLAAFYPHGAWQSRKTYQILAQSADRFPPASNHSDQSWHERFKKNQTNFQKRIERFVQEGIDESLKTAAERQATKQRLADESGAATDGASRDESDRQPKRPRTEPLEQGGRVDPGPDVQVVHDPGETQAPAAAVTDKPTPHESTAQREGARLTQLAARAVNGEEQAASDTVRITLVEETMTVEETSKRKTRLVDLDDETSPPAPIPPSAPQPPNKSILRSPERQRAVMEGRHTKVTSPNEPSRQDESPRRVQIRLRSPQPAAQAPQAAPTADLSRPRAFLPVTLNDLPVSNGAVSTHTVASPPVQSRMSFPFRVELDVRAVPDIPNSRFEQVPASETSRAQFSTPTSSSSHYAPRRSLLQDSIRSSGEKRRRTLERAALRGSGRNRSQSSPDKVYVVQPIPPLPPPSSSSRASTPRPQRPRSPPLSGEERMAKVYEGHNLVKTIQERYKEKVMEYAQRYGIKPGEVYRIVDEMRQQGVAVGSGGLFWDDIDEGFRRRFGR